MHYLTLYDLLALHQVLLADFGGMAGITEAGFARLENAVAAPQQSFFGEDLHPDLASKAAALCATVMSSHPFSDGNKRVAVAALDMFVTLNGATLNASNTELYDFAIQAASGLPREELEATVRGWISEP